MASSGQDVKKFNSSFERSVHKYGKYDSTAGDVYYTPDKIILNVKKPITQWIEVFQNETRLYYPDQHKGICLKSKQESFVNFINTFLASVREDYNLTNQNFSLYENKFKEDSLFSYWRSGQTNVKFMLVHSNNRLVEVESRDEQNNYVTSVCFPEHLAYGGKFYPVKMVFSQVYKGEKTQETVVLSSVRFNEPFPSEIENFKIPDDVELQVIEW